MLSTLKAWLNRIAGTGTGTSSESEIAPVEYKGYRIRPTPYRAKSGYQTAGIIEKDLPGGLKQHRFVRADTFPTPAEAGAFAVTKARQVIDQQGDSIFA